MLVTGRAVTACPRTHGGVVVSPREAAEEFGVIPIVFPDPARSDEERYSSCACPVQRDRSGLSMPSTGPGVIKKKYVRELRELFCCAVMRRADVSWMLDVGCRYQADLGAEGCLANNPM